MLFQIGARATKKKVTESGGRKTAKQVAKQKAEETDKAREQLELLLPVSFWRTMTASQKARYSWLYVCSLKSVYSLHV